MKRLFCILISVLLLINGFFVFSFASDTRNIARDVDDAQLLIIDVSKYQTGIQWDQTADEIDGAVLRIGNRFSASRTIAIDQTFLDKYNSAKAEGVPLGCYFYSTALSIDEIIEETEWIIDTLENNGCTMELPIFLDMEDSSTESLGKTVLTKMARKFCDMMNDAGWLPGIYCSRSWANSFIDLTQMTDAAVWIAQYNSTCTYSGHYDMWQYTDSGNIAGISGSCDVSHCYKDFESYIKTNGLNGFSPSPYKSNETYITPDDSDIVVRALPNLTSEAVGHLTSSFQVFVYDISDGFGKISYDGVWAWIELSDMILLKKKEPLSSGLGTFYVTASNLNVCSGPGTSNSLLGTLPNGTYVEVTRRSGVWAMIEYNGSDAWVSGDYLKFVGKVLFDSNRGSGNDVMLSAESGTDIVLGECDFVRDGYIFMGWSTTRNGTPLYNVGDTVTVGDSNIILYAVWEKIFCGETYLISCSTVLNVRSGPSTTYEKLGTLSNDQQIYVYEVSDNWAKIDFNGAEAWISLDYCQPLKLSDCVTDKLGNYIVTASSLNFRATPGTSGTSLGYLYSGEVVKVEEISDGWGKITRNGVTGWSSMSYLKYLGKVVLDSNRGTGMNTVVYGDASGKVALPTCGFTRKGYSFVGWSLSDDGYAVYDDNAVVEVGAENIILYAVWVEDKPEIFPAENSTTIINENNGFIYGLKQGLTALEINDFIVAGDGTDIIVCSDVIGTGTVFKAEKGTASETYTFVIFGDVNGDSYADGCDAVLVGLYSNGLITNLDLTVPELYAMDVNHDLLINADDINIISDSGIKVDSIAQVC